MSLHEQIAQDYLTAFKGHQQDRTNALRLVKAALKNAEIELRHEPLTDDEIVTVLTREAKRRRESIAAYTQGQRPDLAATEELELKFISGYLPAQLDDAALTGLVTASIAELPTGPKDFGQVMSAVMAKVKGQADGHRVAAAVKQQLK